VVAHLPLPNATCVSNTLDGSEDGILYRESFEYSENVSKDDLSDSDEDFLGFYN
jgi:hypothetical protein